MRDFTKSFFSLGWAMTMFGLEQVRNLVSEDSSGHRRERMAEDMDSIAAATNECLSDRNSKMFESGDKLQREMVDLTFDLFRGEELEARKVVDSAAELVEESVDALRDITGEKKEEPKKKKTRARRRATASSKPATQTA